MVGLNAFCDRIEQLGVPGYGRDEVAFMEATVRLVDPDRIFDWGTNVGASARIFEECRPLQCVVETVELYPVLQRLDRDHAGDRTGQWLSGEIRWHHGDGVTKALELAAIWGALRPLFFLDGNHLGENVFREIWSIHKLAPTGCLLVHDTNQQPGDAVRGWQERYGGYAVEWLDSQAGMARMIPC